jgi:hypothetical protein
VPSGGARVRQTMAAAALNPALSSMEFALS